MTEIVIGTYLALAAIMALVLWITPPGKINRVKWILISLAAGLLWPVAAIGMTIVNDPWGEDEPDEHERGAM